MKKVVAITGGTKGIGLEIARAFLNAEYLVTVGGRSCPAYLEQELGDAARFIQVDVGRKQEAQRFVNTSYELTGRLDVLINCAGVSLWRPLQEIDEDFLNSMMNTNFAGAVWTSQAAIEYLPEGGSILNISSLAGKRGSANNSIYCASKFAMNGITQAYAKELGPRGIRVNAVCPVYIQTGSILDALQDSRSPAGGRNVSTYLEEFTASQTALKRLPTAPEVAETVLFLASDKASGVTGQCLNVDCGVLPQ